MFLGAGGPLQKLNTSRRHILLTPKGAFLLQICQRNALNKANYNLHVMLYSILKVHSSSIDAASAYDADATRDTGTGDTSNDQTK